MPTGMVATQGAGGVVPTQLTAYNPLAQVITTKLERRVDMLTNGFLLLQAQAAAAAGVVPQHLQAQAGASAVTGGKLFTTYPPSFHALR
jgi:hypothetical protein